MQCNPDEDEGRGGGGGEGVLVGLGGDPTLPFCLITGVLSLHPPSSMCRVCIVHVADVSSVSKKGPGDPIGPPLLRSLLPLTEEML